MTDMLKLSMPKQATEEQDMNLLAKSIIDKATTEGKNPAALMPGRMGGLKGGKARAEKLSSSRQSQIGGSGKMA